MKFGKLVIFVIIIIDGKRKFIFVFFGNLVFVMVIFNLFVFLVLRKMFGSEYFYLIKIKVKLL